VVHGFGYFLYETAPPKSVENDLKISKYLPHLGSPVAHGSGMPRFLLRSSIWRTMMVCANKSGSGTILEIQMRRFAYGLMHSQIEALNPTREPPNDFAQDNIYSRPIPACFRKLSLPLSASSQLSLLEMLQRLTSLNSGQPC
jgi:hypothetical protein